MPLWEGFNIALSRRGVTTHVSFSKVTAAVLCASGASDSGVTEMFVILPLCEVSLSSLCSLGGDSPEAEKVLDFFLAGLMRDTLDVNGGRHDGRNTLEFLENT